SFVPRANTTSTLAHESSAAALAEGASANEPVRIAITATAAKIVDTADRPVRVPILTTRGVTELMSWSLFPDPCPSLNCLSNDPARYKSPVASAIPGNLVIYTTCGSGDLGK